MRRASGWTVIEAIVALSIVSVVMVVVTQLIISTSRHTRLQSQRSLQQTRLQSVLRAVEKTLSGCCVAGVSFSRMTSPDCALLAGHAFEEGFISQTPRWEPYWRCFLWDAQAGKFYATLSPTAASAPTATTDKPLQLSGAELGQVAGMYLPGPTLNNGRLLSDYVTGFDYALDSGPLFRVEVEVDVPRDHSPAVSAIGKLKATRLVHPRNRV